MRAGEPRGAGGTRWRVLHLISSAFFGGPERQILEHGRVMRGREPEVVIGLIHEGRRPHALVAKARDEGVAVLEFVARSPLSLRLPWELTRSLLREGFPLVVTHGYKANVLGSIICRVLGNPHACYARGWTDEGPKVGFYQLLDRLALRFAPLVLAVSRATGEKLVARRIRLSRIRVIHNAVNVESLQALPQRPVGELRKELGLAPGDFVFACAGRFSAEKGQLDLLHAFARLSSQQGNARLVFFGEGAMETRLRRVAREEGLEQKVVFAGFRPDFLGELPSCDCLVLPSRSEGLPNVLLEAFALGVPTLACAVGGVPELLRDEVDGVLVEPGDVEALASAMGRFARGDIVPAAMVRSARSRARGEFSFARQALALGDVYEALLARGPGRHRLGDFSGVPK